MGNSVRKEFLSDDEIDTIVIEMFADQTCTEEDMAIARAVQNKVLQKVADMLEGLEDGVWANTCGGRVRKLMR